MADVVVLGAGIAGHTAALHLRRKLGREHTVTVVAPTPHWTWFPSNIWVGVGRMPAEKVLVPLAPVYRKQRIAFLQAGAVAIHPEGDGGDPRGAVDIVHTSTDRAGAGGRIRYDYLINATGPRLAFSLTPGLGPDNGGNTVSVCTAAHATGAATALQHTIATLRAGRPQTLVVGMGHGTCTSESAGFGYLLNVEHELREAGVRDRARLIHLTNEATLGDLGVGGVVFTRRGVVTSSEQWTASILRERGVEAILGAHVERVEPGLIHYETLDGERHELPFDFAMLLPAFAGTPLTAHDRSGADITGEMFAPNGFMKVDADYSAKPYDQWAASDWPSTYMTPAFDNIWAVGIAFAPPHAISRPRTSANGTTISPSAPRTGMPSGIMGRTAALSIVDRITRGCDAAPRKASMATMGAALVASTGFGLTRGSALAMTMRPVVPDHDRFPTGRSPQDTRIDVGLGGHWAKLMVHHLFIHKARARPGWQFIPE